MKRLVFALVLMSVAALTAAEVVVCRPRLAPDAFRAVWKEHGWTAVDAWPAENGDIVRGVFVNGLDVSDDEAARIGRAAEKGAVLYLAVGARGATRLPSALKPWLPVNAWSFKPVLARSAAEISGADVSVSRRFDMHMPGSAIESPMSRYRPEDYYRDPARFHRIAVLERFTGEGELAATVDADVVGTRVVLFAGDFFDRRLQESSGFATWAERLASRPFERCVGSVPERPPEQPALPPFDIAIEEDESTLSELDAATLPPEGIDGVTSYRYIYRCGTAPKLRVRVRNHFANIAPFARSKDELWPENISAAGLNDRAFTTASVRGKLPIHAVWCGRQSDRQQISLAWPLPVEIAGLRLTGYGPYRNRNRNNPKNIVVSADGSSILEDGHVVFPEGPCAERSFYERSFGRTSRVKKLVLTTAGLNPQADNEPRFDGGGKSNCGLAEWEVWGWMGPQVGHADVNATLRIERADLSSGGKKIECERELALPFCSESSIDLCLTPSETFGPVHWRMTLASGGKVVAQRTFDAFFVPADEARIEPKADRTTADPGLLCSPGWRIAHPFGLGMRNWTQGWGGVHDKTWAMSLDLMEIGPNVRDDPARMFTTSVGATHYTDPWRRFPNGEWSWTLIEDYFLRQMAPEGRWHREGKNSIHCVGSDRWNGVPINAAFTWDDFVRFDDWLKRHGKGGLQARSRQTISREIMERYGDEWQRFELETYADNMLATQRRFAEKGIPFTYETHGSFPLAGGELGTKLAKTHSGVGTDAFWELYRQDLWQTLGVRFAVVAANPDFKSGAYGQWGWVNSEQNEFWFASNGDPSVARRQWYAMYFYGRVNSEGTFRPYHETGYGYQGSHGVRYTAADHAERCRVQNLTTYLRPDEPTGIGLVVSWKDQERKMGPKAGHLGFGLYAERGEVDLTDGFRDVYAGLVKAGVPIAFFTSTHALEKWSSSRPLVLIGGDRWTAMEKALVRKLEASGVKTICVDPADCADSIRASSTAARVMAELGNPIVVSAGLTVTPFVCRKRLFLAVCRQGDDTTPGTISIRPEFFLGNLDNSARVVSVDDGRPLKAAVSEDGRLSFRLPMKPYSATMLMLTGEIRK